MFDLVIFDCDGVLVDSEPIANHILTTMLNEAGLVITYEETCRQFTGLSNEACIAEAERMLGSPLSPTFLDEFLERELETLRKGVEPVPGVVDVLTDLRMPVCVASSGMPEKIRTTLGGTGLLPFFEGHIFSVAAVERPKPAPDIYLYAAREMGTPSERCAVIEDSPTGAQAGVAAGMTVFGYAAETGAARLAAVGARVFTDMKELLNLLQ